MGLIGITGRNFNVIAGNTVLVTWAMAQRNSRLRKIDKWRKEWPTLSIHYLMYSAAWGEEIYE